MAIRLRPKLAKFCQDIGSPTVLMAAAIASSQWTILVDTEKAHASLRYQLLLLVAYPHLPHLA